MENNLETDNIESTILDIAAARLALDLETVLITSDTTNGALSYCSTTSKWCSKASHY
jgi:hypothetical protein